MNRRILSLVGLSLTLILASVVLLDRATDIAAWYPSGETTVTPVDPRDQPSPAGGIGNERSDIEAVYGIPSGLRGTMIGYRNGSVGVSYSDGRATALLLPFTSVPDPDFAAAHRAVQGLLPSDVVFVGTLNAGPNRTAEIYRSARLGSAVSSIANGEAAGQITVIYETDATGRVTQALITLGNPAATPTPG